MNVPALTIHATGIVIAGRGVLIRGDSGAGKSLLALDLIAEAEARGDGGILVADDRVLIAVEEGGLVMGPPETLAGLVELRGRGILSVPFRASARIDLVVDLVDPYARMPEADAFSTSLYGVAVARCPVPRRGLADGLHQRLLVLWALRALEEPEPPGV